MALSTTLILCERQELCCKSALYLLEEKKVDSDGRVTQQRWQKHVKEKLIGVDAKPPADTVAQAPQVEGKHEALQHTTCAAKSGSRC